MASRARRGASFPAQVSVPQGFIGLGLNVQVAALTALEESPYTPSMAEPVRSLPIPHEADEAPGFPVLQRWIEHPDGRLELLMRPLTPEDFLNPQPEDTMTEGEPHFNLRMQLADLLKRHFEPNALILGDVIHQLGPGLPSPSPDVSVILGARPGQRASFSVTAEGVRPDLIIEILSPSKKAIRKVDEVDKVEAYSRAGIPEYLLIDLPRRGNAYRQDLLSVVRECPRRT